MRIEKRLAALEAVRTVDEAPHCFVADIDREPPEYFIDGSQVDAETWRMLADRAGARDYIIQVEYDGSA